MAAASWVPCGPPGPADGRSGGGILIDRRGPAD